MMGVQGGLISSGFETCRRGEWPRPFVNGRQIHNEMVPRKGDVYFPRRVTFSGYGLTRMSSLHDEMSCVCQSQTFGFPPWSAGKTCPDEDAIGYSCLDHILPEANMNMSLLGQQQRG